MKIRIMFAAPEARPAFIGNEIEGKVTFNVDTGIASGFFGSFTEFPVDTTQPAVRSTSTAFSVQLTTADMQAIAQIVLARAAEQGVGGMAPTSNVRID